MYQKREREDLKMTISEFRKEAEAVVDNHLEEALWYLTEYRNEIDITDIAMIFADAYHDMIWKLAEELENEEEI